MVAVAAENPSGSETRYIMGNSRRVTYTLAETTRHCPSVEWVLYRKREIRGTNVEKFLSCSGSSPSGCH